MACARNAVGELVVVARLGLLGSSACGELLDGALHTHTDDDCRAATRHLAECCPDFHPGAISCLYDDRGLSGGRAEISGGQASCIAATSCGAVRGAAMSACDRGSIPPKGAKKPSEAGDSALPCARA